MAETHRWPGKATSFDRGAHCPLERSLLFLEELSMKGSVSSSPGLHTM